MAAEASGQHNSMKCLTVRLCTYVVLALKMVSLYMTCENKCNDTIFSFSKEGIKAGSQWDTVLFSFYVNKLAWKSFGRKMV